ncbi:MAG: hypothetical protein ABEI77_04355 [Halorientalis sp.]
MADGGTDPTRQVNEETLRALARSLGRLSAVETTSLFPATRQESLIVSLLDDHYPASIGEVRLEIRLFTNGEFHVAYAERYLGELRQCR